MSTVEITEKDVGRFFRSQNDLLYRVAKIIPDNTYPVRCVLSDDYITYHENDRVTSLTTKGYFHLGGDPEFYLNFKEWADEPQPRNTDNYLFRLNITINDVNNSCKKDEIFCLDFSELIENISNITLNNINSFEFITEQGLFENKGDTLKLSKIIKINGKELGKITIKITQLREL